MTPKEAWAHISDWLDTDQSWITSPCDRQADIVGKLLLEGDLRGNLVADAHLVALARDQGVGICSFDSDVGRFPELNWVNPAMT